MRSAVLAAFPLLGLGAVVPGSQLRAEEPSGLRISVEQPLVEPGGAEVAETLFVAGRVFGFSGRIQRFDVVLALDTSRSTAAPAGADVDGDGELGRPRSQRFSGFASTDPGDSVLAAQLAIVDRLLDRVDLETTRLALLTFSGRSRDDRQAVRLRVPLTRDPTALRRALRTVASEVPAGRTPLAAALERAGAELARDPRPDATPLLLLMTDGEPNLPFALDREACADQARRVLRALVARGVRVDALGIGELRPRGLELLSELSSRSGGQFTRVADPARYAGGFERLHWASLESLELINRTTGKPALAASFERDGRFSAVLALEPGENRLEIRALDHRGRSSRRELLVRHTPGAPAAELPAQWRDERLRLLESRLEQLRVRRVSLEAQRTARLRDAHLEAMRRARAARARSLSVRPQEPVPAAPDPGTP